MDALFLGPLEYTESRFTQYEFPPEGISLLGSAVRRMHKTSMLVEAENFIGRNAHDLALHQLTSYAFASASSYGTLLYEPRADKLGSTITEEDPQTGALVTATLMTVEPEMYYVLGVQMGTGGHFHGTESVSESNYSMRGLTIPAAVQYEYVSADENYHACLTGTIYREIVPRLVGPWYIRTMGDLRMEDNHGHNGMASLDRNARISAQIDGAFHTSQKELQLV